MNRLSPEQRAAILRYEPATRAALTFCAFAVLHDVTPCDGYPSNCVRTMVRPQVLFRPQRVVVAPSCAPFFDLLDFRLGNMSQRAETNPVSCEFFPPLPGDARPKKAFPFGPEGTSAEFFPPLPIEEKAREAIKRFQSTWGADTCQIGTDMILSVRNKSLKPQRFEAIVWGVFVE